MKMLAEIAKDAMELPPGQRLTLARILLELSEPDQDFSPQVETAWEQEIERSIKAIKSGNSESKTFEHRDLL
jgi:hypothetical protein